MCSIFFFLVVFDTCDVLYNWSISLLPTIVLENLFEFEHGTFQLLTRQYNLALVNNHLIFKKFSHIN